MKQISWHVTKEDHNRIVEIAQRAVAIAKQRGVEYSQMDAVMDLTAVHANGCPLNLAALAEATPFDFTHDVFGIRNHINRSTGQLEDCFLPRYAA